MASTNPLEALTAALTAKAIPFTNVGCDMVGDIIAIRMGGTHLRISSELCRCKAYEVGVYANANLESIQADEDAMPIAMFDFDAKHLPALLRLITSGRE